MKMHTRYEHQGFCESNKKQVFTFISPTKASVSISIVAKPGMPSLWMDHLETEVVISGDKVTLTVDYSPSIIGLWQGHVTSDMGSEFDDGEEHRRKPRVVGDCQHRGRRHELDRPPPARRRHYLQRHIQHDESQVNWRFSTQTSCIPWERGRFRA